jgi:hypothetical protein
MLKLILGVSRRADWSRDEWLVHYKERHGPLVAGLQIFGSQTLRYVQNYAFSPPSNAVIPNHAVMIDGISELWYSDLEAIRAAYADPAYMSRIRPDELSFCDLHSIVGGIGREHSILAEPLQANDKKWVHRSRCRLIIYRKAASHSSASTFQRAWLDATEKMSSEHNFRRYVRAYVQTHIENEASPLPTSCPYAVIDEFWFESEEDALAYWQETRSSSLTSRLERSASSPNEALLCFVHSHTVFEDS